jgi:hypothetical protein
MSGGRIVLLVAGILLGVLAFVAFALGAATLAFNHTERDSAGFFSTADESYASEGYAIVSEDVDIGTDGPDWLFEEGRLATVRVRGASEESGRELFIGVAPTEDVRAYLADTRHDVVTDFELDPFRVTYRPSPGDASPSPPADESFWAESASGPGTQTLEWEVTKGDWSFVVMNADASPGVAAALSVGAKVGFIFWIGVALVIVGALLLAGGATLIYLSLRRPAARKERAAVAAG